MSGRSTILFALLLGLSLGCGRGSKTPHVDDHAADKAGHSEAGEEPGHSEDILLSDEAAKIAGVEVGEAKQMPMQAELRAPGIVSASSFGRAAVTPPVAGQISRLLVKSGDTVRVGEALAVLRSPELAEAAAGIIQAQEGLLTAQALQHEAAAQKDLASAKVRTARQVLARQQAFARTGAFSQPGLQSAQRELADAEADLERGKQDQLVHEAQLDRAERLYKQELISRTELEQARLEVATDKIRQRNAERRIELAKATYERERRIAEQGLSNSRELQAAEAELRTANLEVRQAQIRLNSAIAGVAAARKGVEAARTSYAAHAGASTSNGGTLTIKAPIAGVVIDMGVTLGQAVERTTEICEIENLASVLLLAQLSDKQIGQARVGASAQVSVATFPNRRFAGVVQSVGSRLDPKTRSLEVRILVQNENRDLRSGMAGTAHIGVGSRSSTLAVPRSSIVEDGDAKKVYVAEDGGKYEERIVVLGRIQGDFVEVISGLAAGDRVVVKGAFVLKSEKVKAELKGHEH